MKLINCRMLTLEDFIKIDLSSVPCTNGNATGCLCKPQGQECNVLLNECFFLLEMDLKEPTLLSYLYVHCNLL